MKRFEFRLNRVLEYRQQQAEAERNRLQLLFHRARALADERNRLTNQLAESRDEAIGSGTVSGAELMALSQFSRYVENRTVELDKDRRTLEKQIEQQRQVVVAADRRVTLLEKLRTRQEAVWLAEQEKELETLASDSFMARLAANRRNANANAWPFVMPRGTADSDSALDLGQGPDAAG